MVAHTKAVARQGADKANAIDRKAVPNGKVAAQEDVLVDQTAAAASVGADQTDAIAARIAAEGAILPTPAPVGESLGELAQAAPPATTDTKASGATPAADAAPAMSPWAAGGLALLGVGAVVAVANSGDDSPSPAPAKPAA